MAKIALLQIENIGKIKFMELHPKSLTRIVGENDVGKSTILKCIEFVFGGGRSIPNGLVRKGQYTEGRMKGQDINRGFVRVILNDGMEAERVIRINKFGEQVESLTVTGNDTGLSSQQLLNKMKAVIMNPQEISDLTGEKLLPKLEKIMQFDVSTFDQEIDKIKLDSQVVRKQLKDAGAPIVRPVNDKPVKKLDVVELSEKLGLINTDAEKVKTFDLLLKENAENLDRSEKTMQEVDEELRLSFVDVKELTENKNRLDSENNKIINKYEKKSSLESQIQELQEKIEELDTQKEMKIEIMQLLAEDEKQIKLITKEAGILKDRKEKGEKFIKEFNTKKESHLKDKEALISKSESTFLEQAAEVEKDINDLKVVNTLFETWEEYEIDKTFRTDKQTALEENGDLVEVQNRKKAEYLQNLNMPPELSIVDEKVYISIDEKNSVPWELASESLRARISFELCVSAIPEDGLRLFFYHRGESLGTKRLQEVAALAEKNDIDILLEVMSEERVKGDLMTVYIEDGEIHYDNEEDRPKPVEKKAAVKKPAPAAVIKDQEIDI